MEEPEVRLIGIADEESGGVLVGTEIDLEGVDGNADEVDGFSAVDMFGSFSFSGVVLSDDVLGCRSDGTNIGVAI